VNDMERSLVGKLSLLLAAFSFRAEALCATPRTGNRGIESFTLESIQSPGAASSSFRAALQRDSVVVIEPGTKDKAAIAALAAFGEDFFGLPTAARDSFGPLQEPPHSDDHCGFPLPLGAWQSSCSPQTPQANLFLDTRLRRFRVGANTTATPAEEVALGEDGGSVLEVLPRGLGECCPGSERTLVQGQRALFDLGTTALSAALAGGTAVGNNGQAVDVLDLVDCPATTLPVGASSSSVLRFAWYPSDRGSSRSSSSSDSSKNDGSKDDSDEKAGQGVSGVAFGAHTDGTWLTLVPCSRVPGLQVALPNRRRRGSDGGGGGNSPLRKEEEEGGGGEGFVWQCPEVIEEDASSSLVPRPPGSVAVLVGDGLQFISGGVYPSALHRVLRPQRGGAPRGSVPFLLRASARYQAQSRLNRGN